MRDNCSCYKGIVSPHELPYDAEQGFVGMLFDDHIFHSSILYFHELLFCVELDIFLRSWNDHNHCRSILFYHEELSDVVALCSQLLHWNFIPL